MDLSFLWDINFFLFQFIGYKVSLIELVGTITGLLSVWYGAKNNIRIWYLGFINVIAFGIIFFQNARARSATYTHMLAYKTPDKAGHTRTHTRTHTHV